MSGDYQTRMQAFNDMRKRFSQLALVAPISGSGNTAAQGVSGAADPLGMQKR